MAMIGLNRVREKAGFWDVALTYSFIFQYLSLLLCIYPALNEFLYIEGVKPVYVDQLSINKAE